MEGVRLLSLEEIQNLPVSQGGEGDSDRQLSQQLWQLAGQAEGLSGRTLRKLPFLAMTLFTDYTGKLVVLSDAVFLHTGGNDCPSKAVGFLFKGSISRD